MKCDTGIGHVSVSSRKSKQEGNHLVGRASTIGVHADAVMASARSGGGIDAHEAALDGGLQIGPHFSALLVAVTAADAGNEPHQDQSLTEMAEETIRYRHDEEEEVKEEEGVAEEGEGEEEEESEEPVGEGGEERSGPLAATLGGDMKEEDDTQAVAGRSQPPDTASREEQEDREAHTTSDAEEEDEDEEDDEGEGEAEEEGSGLDRLDQLSSEHLQKRRLSMEDVLNAKEAEEARVVLELEAETDTRNPDQETRVDDGMKQTEAEDSDDNKPTAFGLPQVELQDPMHPTRRASLTSTMRMAVAVAADIGILRRLTSRAVRPMDNQQALAIEAARKQLLHTMKEVSWNLLILTDALYVFMSVPFRIGYLYDPWDNGYHANGGTWTTQLTLLTTLDVVGELIRWKYTWKIVKKMYKRRTRVRAGSSAWVPRRLSTTGSAMLAKSGLLGRPMRNSLFSLRNEQSHASEIKSFDAVTSFEALSGVSDVDAVLAAMPPKFVLILGIIPFEVVAAFLNYNWLHIARCGKVLLAGYSLLVAYSRLLLKARGFAWAQWLSFSTLATPFYLFWLGLYLCHLSACGYMLIANVECGLKSQHCVKTPIPGSWVLKDNMEQATLWRQYVRSMYWASKTVTTLGQGDLVPATQMETDYCVVVQFISGLWATAFLASCTFYFSRRDRDIENGVSTRLEQALRFLRSRKVPSTLAIQIRNYYQHIQRTRNGIEEDQVLANLPAHYQFQCAFFVKYRLIAKVPFLSKQSKAFLRTVVAALDSDFHSPKDVILALFDIEELIIVARGDVSVLNQEKELVHVLSQEEWFAEDALFDDHRSQFELEAKTFCEVYRLSRLVFLACMEKHFPKIRIAAVMAQQQRRPAVSPPRSVQAARPTTMMMRPHSTKTSLLRLLTATNGLESVPWQHPDSVFRRRWTRWKAFFLLFLSVEAPFEVAFKWRRGFFDETVVTSDRVVYLMAIATEIFFYIDWYFRAYKFTRRDHEHKAVVPGGGGGREDTHKSLREDMAATVVRKRDDLITKPTEIWKLYLASDDVVFDVIAMVPISVVWNFVNRTSFSIILREFMRCARLLALGRVFALKPVLKRIMVEFDFSPASHLLTNVVVFCIITANAMACYFYLIADDKDFIDALPVGFDPSLTPVSSAQCLEQATLYGNCTWFVYDRSTFAIEARYIRSMHWSLVLLSTVGYGDILSFSNSECLIGFWWIFLGALICYFTSCAVGSVISQVTVLRTAHDDRVEEITRALVRSNVSLETRVQIRCHYEANWELNGSVGSEESLMKRLPRSLRHQLSSSLYLHSLRKCYIFAGFGGQLNMIREIALAMTSMIVLPHFPIVESGHLSAQMYLVQSGEVEILLPLRLRGGSVLSVKKDALLLQQLRMSTHKRLWRAICSLFSRRRKQDSSISDDHYSGLMSASTYIPRGERYRLRDVPISVLREGECFGEEGLLPHERLALHTTVRALTSTQVAVLHRDDFLSLSDRFPLQLGQMIALITKRYQDNRQLVSTIRGNLDRKDKVREFLGSSNSVYAEVKAVVNGIITPDRDFHRVWHAVHGLILLYNFYQITFRLAFVPSPTPSTMIKLCAVDYLIDVFLYADIYFKWNRFGYEQYGENVTNLYLIRRRYKSRWFKVDCLSMLPLYYYGDYFFMTVARVPRLLKTPQLLELIDGIESMIREKFMKGSTTLLSLFDLLKFFVYFLSAAHHVGSCYYLLGRVLTTYGFADASWMTMDFVINTYPDEILVHYNRAVYWCLETFTVVCFGDVIARSPLETVFASMTCIIGWMCIGQVVGRITSLMASIDKDMKEHNERVDNFEQYARNRRLPTYLRERAVESVEYKSKCLIELNMASIFDDLPQALHVILFEELHGQIIRGVPDLVDVCTVSQIRVLANAFRMEIFVTDDIIIEEGRLGTKLYVMKEGRAEYFSAQSRMVFAAVHEGVLFGDLAFFLSGTRQIASIRASRSCQVLYLDRTTWQALWSDETRQQLEAKFVPLMRSKYRSVSRAFLNIVKNLELSMHTTTRPSTTLCPGSLQFEHASSTRSLQSSHASQASGPSSSLKDSELSDPQAIHGDRHASQQSGGVTSGRGWFGHGRGKVVPALGPRPPSFRSRKKMQKKRKESSGGNHRKLPAVLGIAVARPLHMTEILTQDQSNELQWQRHERNLRVLQFIDHRVHQEDVAVGHRTLHSGRFDRHSSDLHERAVQPQQNHASVVPSIKEDAHGQSPTSFAASPKPFPNSARDLLPLRANTASPTKKSKRHSIQVDRTDLKQAFRAADDRSIEKERHIGARSPPTRAPQTADIAVPELPHSPPSVLSKLSNAIHPTKHEAESPNSANHSTGSSGSALMDENEPSAYVQHLQNLQMRSQRRQRRSVFTVVTKAHIEQEADETKNPYEIWLEPPLPPAFCLENSQFRRRWSAVMYAICMYYILIVPFRVSFDFDYLTSPETTTMTTMWFLCEYVMDLLCLVDFFLHKNYFAFVHRGTLITDKRAIRDHYLREGTYIVDLICILPLELLIPLVPFLQAMPTGSSPGAHSKVTWYRIAVFRLNKMVRIAHLHSLGDKIQRMLVYDVTSLSFVRPSMVYFVRFAFDFALGAHWVACLFFGVAFNTFIEGVPSWLTTPGMLTFEGIHTEQEIGDVHWLMKYSRSYHFSMGAITTVSYGDVAPQNAWETFVGTFVIVISIVLFGMLSGGFSQVFEMEMGKRADYEEKIASVAHFMMFHRFPARIWKHMQSYFMVHWKESQGMHEEELLSGLPLSVKRDIALFAKQDFVKQMRLFAGCEEAFVRAVVAAFDQELFVRNDVIITYGERGRRSLYVIESGNVLVRVPKKIDASKSSSGPDTAAANATLNARGGVLHFPGDPTTSRPPSPSRPLTRTTLSQGADIEIVKGRFDFFGEKSLIFDVPRSATCIALSSCSMLILTLEKYEEILLEFPEYREKNMREWIFANARENTPAVAIRSPTRLLAKIRSKQSMRTTLAKEAATAATAPAAALSPSPAASLLAGTAVAQSTESPTIDDTRSGPVMTAAVGIAAPPPPRPPTAPSGRPPLPPMGQS